jgi:quercetin dioxygenase-like cupin family protein
MMLIRAVKKLKTTRQVIPVSVKPLPRVLDVISRRQLLLTAVSAVLLPGRAMANTVVQKKLNWSKFKSIMNELADADAHAKIDQETLVETAIKALQKLDVGSDEFIQAKDDSYETGNRYWFWQRLIKQRNLNGGILTIEDTQMVQLHDHPGATGMLRILSGEAEVWLFDEVRQNKTEQGVAELARVSRRVLRAGDTAVLTPNKGNVHALRSLTKECSMLDFFIPPYEKSQRSWFEPLEENWFDMEKVSCRKISQHAYTKA